MIVGHRARNHPQQLARRGADIEVDDRRTPPDLLAECAALVGVQCFTLDVAATEENTVAPRWCDDGLIDGWHGHVWCNPPYSDIGPWVDKSWQEWDRDAVLSITMLLPANRTEQHWWQHHIEPHRRAGTLACYFLAGRRRFNRPGWTKPAKGDRPPFGLVVVSWRVAS